MERIRSFIAVSVNKPDIVDKICRVQEELSRCGGRLKLVESENLHITLRFLGEVLESQLQQVYEKVLLKLEWRPFLVRLKGVGAFPNERRPRVVWIGVEEGHDELIDLSRQIENGLRKLGFPKESKEFHPHVTIARVKIPGNVGSLGKLFSAYREFVFGEFTVEKVELKKSVLTPKGPIYSTLKEVGPKMV